MQTFYLISSITVPILLLIVIFILLTISFKVKKIIDSSDSQLSSSLIALVEEKDKTLKDSLQDLRKEIRDVSSENRKEFSDTIKNFQESVVKMLNCNASDQIKQLDNIKLAFGSLSEKLIKDSAEFKDTVNRSFSDTSNSITKKQDTFREQLQEDAKDNRNELKNGLLSFESKFSEETKKFGEQLGRNFETLAKHQKDTNFQAKKDIIDIRDAIEKNLKEIREDNTKQLDQMRMTVDEKLQSTLEKRLSESFKQVSERLEQVHKGLGDMQNLAVGVGDLKKVLSNVKTRGVLGEYQLANILEQILAPEQYESNVKTKADSRDHVEFAIKLPGKQDDDVVWLPIDSKFPLESWRRLQAASESHDQIATKNAQVEFLRTVENFAKDISLKYVDPPKTTNFAVLFLPIEGLYAEVMRHPEIFERLQRDHRITITGPTTLSALLSSLNMGFRTLAVQKRTSEVWKVLALLKNEFKKYTDTISIVSNQFSTACNTLDKLQTTRTNQMMKKLVKLDSLEDTMGKVEIGHDESVELDESS